MTFVEFFVGLIAISLALSAIMTGAWLIQQRTGNSGWVDTVWTFGLGAVGAAAALAPVGAERRAAAADRGRGLRRDLGGAARPPYRQPQRRRSPTIRAMPT